MQRPKRILHGPIRCYSKTIRNRRIHPINSTSSYSKTEVRWRVDTIGTHPFTHQLALIIEYPHSTRHVEVRRGDHMFLLEQNIQRNVHTNHQIQSHVSNLSHISRYREPLILNVTIRERTKIILARLKRGWFQYMRPNE